MNDKFSKEADFFFAALFALLTIDFALKGGLWIVLTPVFASVSCFLLIDGIKKFKNEKNNIK